MVADEQVNFFPDVSGECCLRIMPLPNVLFLWQVLIGFCQ